MATPLPEGDKIHTDSRIGNQKIITKHDSNHDGTNNENDKVLNEQELIQCKSLQSDNQSKENSTDLFNLQSKNDISNQTATFLKASTILNAVVNIIEAISIFYSYTYNLHTHYFCNFTKSNF